MQIFIYLNYIWHEKVRLISEFNKKKAVYLNYIWTLMSSIHILATILDKYLTNRSQFIKFMSRSKFKYYANFYINF